MTSEATNGPAPSDAERTEALVNRLFEGALGAIDVVSVYVGDRLGLYKTLAESGPSTSEDLASRAGIQERYAREWLEHQAVTGILDVDEAAKEAAARRYTLPAGTPCPPPTPRPLSTWTAWPPSRPLVEPWSRPSRHCPRSWTRSGAAGASHGRRTGPT